MRALPKSITILGREIPIQYLNDKQFSDLLDGIKNADQVQGLWCPWARTIYIRNTSPVHIQLYYIYHEATHAMFSITGLNQKMSAAMEEVHCQSNASFMEDHLKWIVKHFTDKPKKKK